MRNVFGRPKNLAPKAIVLLKRQYYTTGPTPPYLKMVGSGMTPFLEKIASLLTDDNFFADLKSLNFLK